MPTYVSIVSPSHSFWLSHLLSDLDPVRRVLWSGFLMKIPAINQVIFIASRVSYASLMYEPEAGAEGIIPVGGGQQYVQQK